MSLKSMTSDSVKEKLSLSNKTVVKLLLALILIVTFEHSFEILSYFSKTFAGTVSTIGLVIWMDLMMFFSLKMVDREASLSRKIFGWSVFMTIILMSAFLNSYYMWHHKPSQFEEVISQLLSIMIGVVAPLGVVFLGMIYQTSDTTIAQVEADRIRKAEKADAPTPTKSEYAMSMQERHAKIRELHALGYAHQDISKDLGVSRQTVWRVLGGKHEMP